MAASVVDRTVGTANGVSPDNMGLATYSAGDLLLHFFSDGAGILITSTQTTLGQWAGWRSNQFTTVGMNTAEKIADGTEGSQISLTFTGNSAKTYISTSITGFDPYRGVARVDSLGGELFDGAWNSTDFIDPPLLTHPFGAGEEILWIAFGVADASAVGSADPTGGPTADFTYVDFDGAPAAGERSIIVYAELTNDDPSWNPALWSLAVAETRRSWTMAVPPAVPYSHPDCLVVQDFVTGSLATAQDVTIVVPAHTNGKLWVLVAGGDGSTATLDPAGLNIAMTVVEQETSLSPYYAHFFECDSPAAGSYTLRIDKTGASNNARVVMVYPVSDPGEMSGSIAFSGTDYDISDSITTTADTLVLAATVLNEQGSAISGLLPNADCHIDGVPMSPRATRMSTAAVVSPANSNLSVRTYAGRASGATQTLRGLWHRGGAVPYSAVLALFVQPSDKDNPIWASTDF